jgi:hypothetical protein
VIRISVSAYRRGLPGIEKRSRTAREGGLVGCWYLAARGTGVFLRTGRTLRAVNRSQMVAALPTLNESSIAADAREPPLKRELSQSCLEGLATVGSSASCGRGSSAIEDFVPLCTHLRAAGYETLVLNAMEVVSCSNECIAGVLRGACVGGLQTGWRGSKGCACDDSQPLVNCAHTSARALPWPSAESSPVLVDARRRPRTSSANDSTPGIAYRSRCGEAERAEQPGAQQQTYNTATVQNERAQVLAEVRPTAWSPGWRFGVTDFDALERG